MALLCNDCRIEGSRHKPICKHTDMPCVFLRYCAVSMKYYQTDAAADCGLKGDRDGNQ